jgi:hypothetical protein
VPLAKEPGFLDDLLRAARAAHSLSTVMSESDVAMTQRVAELRDTFQGPTADGFFGRLDELAGRRSSAATAYAQLAIDLARQYVSAATQWAHDERHRRGQQISNQRSLLEKGVDTLTWAADNSWDSLPPVPYVAVPSAPGFFAGFDPIAWRNRLAGVR